MRKKIAHDEYEKVLAELRTVELRGDRVTACSATVRETRVIAGARCVVATTFRVHCFLAEPGLRVHATLVRVEIGAEGGDWFAIGRFESRDDAPLGLRLDPFRAYKAAYADAEYALRFSQRFKAHLALAEAALISHSTRAPAPRRGSVSRL